MKILICTNHSYMFYQFRKELTQELLKDNEVLLSTPFVGHQADLARLGCHLIETPIDRRGINPITDLSLARFYRTLLKREKPDLVITYSIKPNIYAGTVCDELHIPYCVNVQGLGSAFERPVISTIVTKMYKHALKHAKTTFFENEGDANTFVKLGIQTKDKQTVLHGAGINLESYPLQPYPTNDTFHFLYLGRIMKEKGMDELFTSLKQLKANGYEFICDFVGFFEESYEEQIKDLERQGIIQFHGFQEDPRPFYKQSDCVILPSYHEGMSNVLLEAAATGRPLITTNIHGCKEAVIDNKTGYLCEPKNQQSLYQKMEQILQTTTQQREQMGIQGRQHMEQTFSKELVVQETIKQLF